MQPSSKYASTEKTYAGGFVYKETNSTFSDIFALDDPIDMSVSYTTPINSNFNKVNMGGWNSTSAAAYVSKRQRFRKEWTQSGGGKGYSNVNGLAVSKSPFASAGNVTIVFSKGAGNKYYFGKSAQAGATIGSFGQKLITDFEVNKVIFKITLLTGWTKAEFDYYKANGSLQDTDGSNIDINDFMTNPSNYLIRTFDVAPVAYWDGSTWKANNLSNSPNIHINFLIDTDKVSGICNIQKHHYDNAAGTGSYGGLNFSVYNSTSGNTTEIASLVRGSVVSELQNIGSGTGGFVLDSATDPLELDPDLSLDEMTNMCDTGVLGAGDTLPAHEISWCSALTVLKYDQYTLSYDVGSSGQTHFTRYNMYCCVGMKGEYVNKLFAYAGVYFYTGSLQNLNDSGATPTNLKVTGMRLGEMNAAGQTTGNWITPDQMDDYKGINKKGSIIHPGYTPTPPVPVVSDEDNTDPVNTTGAPFASGLCHYYALTAGSVLLEHISDALGTWDIENTHKDLYKNLVSCKLIKPPAPIPTTGSAPFTIYGVKPQYEGADITLPVVSGNPTATFGPYLIDRKFGDFRDYAPYTRVSIYLPYCGWCDLPSHVVGRQVSVHYYTDIIAATCKAVVFCSNNIIAEAAGVIGLDIPFVADNVGAKMQAVTAGMIAALGGGIQLGAGIGTMVSTKSGSGAKAALSGASQYLSGYSQMAMAFNENTTEISGKNGDGCCLAGATNIIIKIVRPKKGAYSTAPYTPPGYGHNVGFVSQKQVKVSSVSGLLIADNADTSGISGATEAERAEIKRVLETGLIVNAAPNNP